MEIIYIDPGYGKGVTDAGQTLSCVESDNYNPINGVAYTFSVPQTDSPMHFLPIPTSALAVPTVSDGQFFTKVVSFKVSVYFALECQYNCGIGFQKDTTKTNGASLDWYSLAMGFADYRLADKAITQNVQKVEKDSGLGLHQGTISICLVKYLSGGSAAFRTTAYAEFDGEILSDTKVSTSVDNETFGNGLQISFPGGKNNCFYVSNIIVASLTEISDTSPEDTFGAPILSSDTTLIKLPLSTPPSGNFSAEGDGKYVGTASGQQLLQTIDAENLITKFGGDTKVNNLIVYGNPGYKTGNGITTAYGGSVDDYGDGKFTTHGSCTLSADPNAIASVAWETDDDLNGINGGAIGWRI